MSENNNEKKQKWTTAKPQAFKRRMEKEEAAEEENNEEIHDIKPYKHSQTEEQKKINGLTEALYRRNHETRILKQSYEAVKQERDMFSNYWREAVGETIEERRKHHWFRLDVQEFMERVNKLRASLDAILIQGEFLQEVYNLKQTKKHEEEEDIGEIDLGYEYSDDQQAKETNEKEE